jgi:hypothetical protein
MTFWEDVAVKCIHSFIMGQHKNKLPIRVCLEN